MALPYVKETITDGALGLVSGDAKKVFAVVGIASGLAANAVFAVNNPQTLKATAGSGPAVEQVAQILQESGGSATVLLVSPTATAGSLVAGTPTTGALGTIVNNASAPVDDLDLVVKIVKAGAVGVATFAYSLDAGRTFSPEIATAASYTIPGTGVSLTFSSTPGAFVATHTYPFEAKGPSVTVGNLGTALAALLADPRDFSLLHVVGMPADTATHVSVVAAVQAQLDAAAVNHRPARAFVDAPEVSEASYKTSVGTIPTTTLRVLAPGDFCALGSLVNAGRIEKRPAAWPMMARAAAVPISEALHATARGELARVYPLKSQVGDPVTYAYHDDANTLTDFSDADRIAALRSWPGQPGVYVARARTLAALTSDFTELQHGRIIDEAQRICYRYVFPLVGSKLEVDKVTGRISEKAALALEAGGRAALMRGLVNEGHAVDVQFIVERTDNLISTKLLKYKFRVLPFGYADFIEGEGGLLNPALAT